MFATTFWLFGHLCVEISVDIAWITKMLPISDKTNDWSEKSY